MGAASVVVWSPALKRIPADEWQVGDHTHSLRNDIDTSAYAAAPSVAIPGFDRRAGEVVIGTVAGLRRVKDLPHLVRAAATLPPHVRLVIVREGPAHAENGDGAAACGMAERPVLTRYLAASQHRTSGGEGARG